MEQTRAMGLSYRAWDIKNRVMVQDALSLSSTGQLITVNSEYFNAPLSFQEGCVWMMGTDCYDMNGQEIFEGDILMVRAEGKCIITDPVEHSPPYLSAWSEEYCIEGLDYVPQCLLIIGNKYEPSKTLTWVK